MAMAGTERGGGAVRSIADVGPVAAAGQVLMLTTHVTQG